MASPQSIHLCVVPPGCVAPPRRSAGMHPPACMPTARYCLHGHATACGRTQSCCPPPPALPPADPKGIPAFWQTVILKCDTLNRTHSYCPPPSPSPLATAASRPQGHPRLLADSDSQVRHHRGDGQGEGHRCAGVPTGCAGDWACLCVCVGGGGRGGYVV